MFQKKIRKLRQQGTQDIRNRGNEIAAQLFAEYNPDISHLLDSCGYGGFFGGRCGHIAGELQENFFETDGGGRNSLRSQPASTMERARSPRTSLCRLSTSKTSDFRALVLEDNALHRNDSSEFAPWPDRRDRARANFHQQGFSTAARFCKLLTESVRDELPLLMMMTCSQVCSTSGRFAVLKMMV